MKRIVTALVVLSVMLVPGSALAHSSTCQAYNPQQCNVSSGTEATSPSATSGVTSTGRLPFTGLDVGLLVGGGTVLLLVGVIARTRIKRLG